MQISSEIQAKTKKNIPILPVGILDFCKQKLLAPPVKPMNHLKRGDFEQVTQGMMQST